jgi:hypothetical protein
MADHRLVQARPIRPCSTKRSTPQAVTGFETEAA